MADIDINRTLGDLVAENPDRAAVMEAWGLDFCCGGSRTLDQACREAGLDAATVARLLANAPASAKGAGGSRGSAEPDPRALSLTELVDHIEQTHHVYLREALPRLQAQAAKVREAHGDSRPEVREMGDVLAALIDELDLHMQKEEQILFPGVRTLEQTRGAVQFHCGSLANPIRVMEMEHDGAGEALARLRELSGGYQPPAGACETFRAWYRGLVELEHDLHRHIHKENNVLFPRVLALEERSGGAMQPDLGGY